MVLYKQMDLKRKHTKGLLHMMMICTLFRKLGENEENLQLLLNFIHLLLNQGILWIIFNNRSKYILTKIVCNNRNVKIYSDTLKFGAQLMNGYIYKDVLQSGPYCVLRNNLK